MLDERVHYVLMWGDEDFMTIVGHIKGCDILRSGRRGFIEGHPVWRVDIERLEPIDTIMTREDLARAVRTAQVVDCDP